MTMNNLIPVPIFKYRDDVNNCFYPDAVEAAKDEYWDYMLKRVIRNTDKNIPRAEEYDATCLNISLEFSKKSHEELAASSKEN